MIGRFAKEVILKWTIESFLRTDRQSTCTVCGHPIVGESGDLVEFVGTVMDVTERREGEEALRKAQVELAHVTRVTTVGAMTASIAHELNQPLAPS